MVVFLVGFVMLMPVVSYNSNPYTKLKITISSINKKERDNSILMFKLIGSISLLSQQNNANAVGINSGLLNPCITDKECISSQDDRPFCFMPPWSYEGKFETAKNKLVTLLKEMKGCRILVDDDRYIRVEFIDSKNIFIDEVEFFFTVNDYTIQFRAYRKTDNNLEQFRFLNNNSNRDRLEKIRLKLNFEEIEVIRNRKRLFIFGESPFDTFGPSLEFEELIDNISGDMMSSSNELISVASKYPIWQTKYPLS